MTEAERAKRNINPTKGAVAAMFIYHDEYAARGVGSMDFWDGLTLHEKAVCEDCVGKIEAAR